MSVFEGLNPPYSTIVADPPWELQKVRRRVRPNQGASLDYSTMSLEAIRNLPVATIAAERSTLFLWTIDRYLYRAPEVLSAWGFKYHLTMAWDKGNGLSIYGFNRRTEFVLVGLRGTHDAYPERQAIRTGFASKAGRHSTKPDCFFDMLDVLPGPRVELFARAPRLGWDSWGKGYELSEAS